MVYIFNQMSKVRWHPLPVDSQVVAAIEDRKDKFMKSYTAVLGEQGEEQWVFNHICTVLDHAKKIFQMSEEEFLDPTLITQAAQKIVEDK